MLETQTANRVTASTAALHQTWPQLPKDHWSCVHGWVLLVFNQQQEWSEWIQISFQTWGPTHIFDCEHRVSVQTEWNVDARHPDGVQRSCVKLITSEPSHSLNCLHRRNMFLFTCKCKNVYLDHSFKIIQTPVGSRVCLCWTTFFSLIRPVSCLL